MQAYFILFSQEYKEYDAENQANVNFTHTLLIYIF